MKESKLHLIFATSLAAFLFVAVALLSLIVIPIADIWAFLHGLRERK